MREKQLSISPICLSRRGLGEPLFGHQRAVPPETDSISVSITGACHERHTSHHPKHDIGGQDRPLLRREFLGDQGIREVRHPLSAGAAAASLGVAAGASFLSSHPQLHFSFFSFFPKSLANNPIFTPPS